ncbi:class D beta-lactamase [Priestia filamentosa]|uniref:class D beta-lactamase n=1 Tax=Priestia filamentosa TaxID=1402861 RepID=UPI001C1E061A|nr:class D beta-lactamase [Priestia filamentosa]
MKKLISYITVFLLVCSTVTIFLGQPSQRVHAAKNSNVKELNVGEFFNDKNGTFVLRDMKTGKTLFYNKERAQTRFAPQSTFKIPNSLIGLQVGAVRDEYDIKYWDGEKREIEEWNRDHTLGSALRYSVVWYYQEMARDIGNDRMKEWIEKISYGNKDISGGIDQFWLSSSLKISPLEQVDFIEELYKEELPFDLDVMRTVKRMMVQKEGRTYTIHAKTGQGSEQGWYVGYVEREGHDYAFAVNLDGTSAEAKRITEEVLQKYKLIISKNS